MSSSNNFYFDSLNQADLSKKSKKFNSLEMIFENNKKVAMTRFNIFVVVKAAEIKGIYFDIL